MPRNRYESGSNWWSILESLRNSMGPDVKVEYSGCPPIPGCDTLEKLTSVPTDCALIVDNDPDPRYNLITIEQR
jgi:hypothetical protein